MYTKTILPAVAALGFGFASAQCDETEYTINAQADVSQISGCETVEGNVIIGSNAAGALSLDGPETIKGDLTVADNGALNSLSSSSLATIGGAFTMKNVTALTSLNMADLTKVQSMDWQSLTRLETVAFSSSGLSQADSIRISDTFLSTLNAISVTSTKRMQIDNNRRLNEWTSGLETLSDELVITSNGLQLTVDFPELIWIANMTISNVSAITIPSLAAVNGSIRFTNNFFENFSAPNMTQTIDGDISFTGNGELTNISFPILTTVAGGFTIANNTKLEAIDSFPKLKTIGGAVKLRGNFTTVELPALDDVKGAFDIASTADIDETCDTFTELAPSSDGGNGKIQGTFTCVSSSENANDVDSDAESGTSSSGDDDDDEKDAAGSLSVSISLVLGAAAFGIAQALL